MESIDGADLAAEERLVTGFGEANGAGLAAEEGAGAGWSLMVA